MMIAFDRLLESDTVPDPLVRMGIRRLLRDTLREKNAGGVAARHEALAAHIESLKQSPIAVETQAANEQHYEVPTRFYQLVLGPNLKYSSGFWKPGATFAESETDMLALTCERAELADGQRILELGCGWGSLSLWMAAHYPNSRITAVSNSRTQKAFIDEEARRRSLPNLEIVTADMNVFDTEQRFDRCVSVEMFEHMKNYQLLLKQVGRWLNPGGKLFVHIFTHRELAYHYEDRGPSDWMARYFFAGGQMPSDDLLLHFQDDVRIERRWALSGEHYQQTSEAWLQNMDRHRDEIHAIFAATYGEREVRRWWVYWRVFFMACAELWGYAGGEEWIVSHYRFVKP